MPSKQPSKFEAVNLALLIRYVQAETIKLKTAKALKKSFSTKTMKSRLNDLNEAKIVVLDRLSKLDRSKPSFFPIGSLVEYRLRDHKGKLELIEALVTKHYQEGLIDIQVVNGNDEIFTVSPGSIKLIHVRHESI